MLSPSPNISTRSLRRLPLSHLTRYLIFATSGGSLSGMVRGIRTVCFGCCEKRRCRPPLLVSETLRSEADSPKLDMDLQLVLGFDGPRLRGSCLLCRLPSISKTIRQRVATERRCRRL